jgi:hypothetical protein
MLQTKELNSSNVPQRINALLALEEQINLALENLKRRQQTMKKYFDKQAKAPEFKINEKVLLWDSTHAERGRHSKFQKLWLGPFKISFILGTKSYLLNDLDDRLFSYSTNGFCYHAICTFPKPNASGY